MQPHLLPLFNNGAPIELPTRLQRSASAKKSATPSTMTSAATSDAPKIPVRSESLRDSKYSAGNIGMLDDSNVSVEVELSSECKRKAERSIWWVPRH
jgi:hypothetical protein